MVLMQTSSGCCSFMIGSSQDVAWVLRGRTPSFKDTPPPAAVVSMCYPRNTRRMNMRLGVRRLAASMATMASVVIATSPALAQGARMGQRDGQNDGQHHGQVTPYTPQPSSPFNRIYAPLPYNPRPVIQRP